MKKRLGNIDELRSDLEELKELFDATTDEGERETLKGKISEIEKRIKELNGNQSSAPKPKTGNANKPKPSTGKANKPKSNTSDRCKDLEAEVKDLKEQMRKQGITPKSQRNAPTRTTKPQKGTASGNKNKKRATTNQRTTANQDSSEKPTKQTNTKQRGGSKGNKTAKPQQGGDDAQAPNTKTRKVSEKQIQAKAKKEAKEAEKKVQQEAKALKISSNVAKKFQEYNFAQSVVRRALQYEEKPITYTTAFKFWHDIKLANDAGVFNKETPSFAQINSIFTELGEKLNSPTFAKNKKGNLTLPKAEWAVLKEISEVNKGFLTVKYANEFINISKRQDAEGAKALVKKIQNAEKREAVTPTTPFYKEMKEAETKAEAGEFVKYSHALKGIPKKKRALNGLMGTLQGLGCTCENYRKNLGGTYGETDNEGKQEASYPETAHSEDSEAQTMTIEEIRNKEYDYYEFDEKWCKLFQAPGTNFKYMFYGEPGSGKTALSMQFTEYLASQHELRVLYVTAEEFDSKSFQDKVVLNGLADNNVIVANKEFREMDLSAFDVIFIDSVQRLGMSPKEFDELVETYPEKAFVLLFQMTKGGDYKGGKDWEHNLDGTVKVDKNTNTATAYKRYTTNGQYNLKVF
jgi:DNA replication protein DnaC